MSAEMERRIAVCKSAVTQIYTMLQTRPNDRSLYLNSARSVISSIDTAPFMSIPGRVEEQTWLIEGLQRLAYHDPDDGVRDVAQWCQRQWLAVLANNPTNVETLRGGTFQFQLENSLGQNWLSLAQPCLARIHRDEGSSSSSGSNGRNRQYSDSDDARDAARATAEATVRLGAADYVEARGILQPATEYLARAVQAAESQGIVTGQLLVSAAEANMSLGNVSYQNTNEQYFRQALQYLRRASDIPGYTLSQYLQQYLDDYSRLLT
ncbi:MAG: hypothetical protein M1827_004282 [Pycnora praestabilis]|nr:MAG: hypothetical protein M1827_004282 [Pycnora praestabilis]